VVRFCGSPFALVSLSVGTTVTSARKKCSVPVMGAPLPPRDSLAIWDQQAKLGVNLCTSSSLGTPSFHFAHNYYPFALDHGGRLAPMAVDIVVRLTVLVSV
jgi:hypothetical protein